MFNYREKMNRDYSYPLFDFYDFLGELKDIDFPEILSICLETIQKIEGKSYGVKGAVRMREQGGHKFAA